MRPLLPSANTLECRVESTRLKGHEVSVGTYDSCLHRCECWEVQLLNYSTSSRALLSYSTGRFFPFFVNLVSSLTTALGTRTPLLGFKNFPSRNLSRALLCSPSIVSATQIDVFFYPTSSLRIVLLCRPSWAAVRCHSSSSLSRNITLNVCVIRSLIHKHNHSICGSLYDF